MREGEVERRSGPRLGERRRVRRRALECEPLVVELAGQAADAKPLGDVPDHPVGERAERLIGPVIGEPRAARGEPAPGENGGAPTALVGRRKGFGKLRRDEMEAIGHPQSVAHPREARW